ncbi:MAG: HNH endonuclease [Alphaproteobacteria bacterium]|nr:HNH endonuclease [Alphaproteobacteria bacterium]
MPWSAPKHCPRGHAPYQGSRCPICSAAFKAAADARRPSARQRGYDGKWERESKAYLAAHPQCVSCGSPASLVDHVQPHRGDRRLFWSRSNWQPMCASCHGRKTVREDGGFGNPVASRPGGGFEF